MKKVSIILMALCFALSANAFASVKHHSKHKHHAKSVATTPADPATASPTPAK